jgi:transcriptional regulator with XRE-family HTH domain
MKQAQVPDTDHMARRLGENFVRLRRARGLSQTELGDQTEMHRNDISLIERGRRRPRIDVLVKVATALGVRPSDLLEGIAWIPATGKKAGRFRVDGR